MGKYKGYGNSFSLIVVLFILLIIVGGLYFDNDRGYGHC